MFFVLALAACGHVSGGVDAAPGKQNPPLTQEYLMDTELINESSGLARSHRDPNLLWTHNDSGGKTQTYAIDLQGRYQGTLTLQKPALNLDWEDMTSFVEDGVPKLLLADIGDNSAFRPFLTLYIVDEPETAGLARPFELKTLPLLQVEVVYPEGPRDAESIAVDAAERAIYILSKREAQPKLYRLPLSGLPSLAVAENLGAINIPRAPEGVDNPERINWVTSMDINDDASLLCAQTLTKSYVYRRRAGESWQAALQRAPEAVDIPGYRQIEACAFSADGRALFITSEGQPAPMARIALPPEP